MLQPRDPKMTETSMFERLNPTVMTPPDDPITWREQLTVGATLLSVFFGSLFAAIALEDRPHGPQVATLLGYSGFVFVYTFFRTRGVPTRHRLTAPYVRRELSRLLLIHVGYLLVLYGVAGWLFARTPGQLPPFWVFLVFMVIGLSQVILSRTLLGRAERAATSAATAR